MRIKTEKINWDKSDNTVFVFKPSLAIFAVAVLGFGFKVTNGSLTFIY